MKKWFRIKAFFTAYQKYHGKLLSIEKRSNGQLASKWWGWVLDLVLSDPEVDPMHRISIPSRVSGEMWIQMEISGVGKPTSPNFGFFLFA